jgi:hypothetical protein
MKISMYCIAKICFMHLHWQIIWVGAKHNFMWCLRDKAESFYSVKYW